MFGERDVPLGINTALAAVVVVVLCAVPSSVTGPEIDARLAVIAVGLTVLAAAIVDVAAVMISVGIAFLLFNGLVEGDHGTLVWHGRADLVRLGVLCLAGGLGLIIGAWQERGARKAAKSCAPSGPKVPSPRTPAGARSERASRPVPESPSRGTPSDSRGTSGIRRRDGASRGLEEDSSWRT